MKRIFTTIALLSAGAVCAFAAGKVEVTPCNRSASSSFAIFVDSRTYADCKEEIDAYRDVLQSEGLGTYILSGEWDTPEEVKSWIVKLSKKQPALEGMTFVGDIPVVRVRRGQFNTTAFKMNERTFDKIESSVTSDRYYDDLGLDFTFVCRDSINPRHFYYNLTEKGDVYVSPDFYSSRIMVPAEFPGDKAKLMKDFFKRAVAAHKEENPLDKFYMFSGHGYNSDCLTLWNQLPTVYKEYFPEAFKRASGNKFYNFRKENFVKFDLFNEIQRSDVDIFLFSEHGAPDTQYINGEPEAVSLNDCVEYLKRSLRSSYKRILAKNPQRAEKFINDVESEYHFDPSMFSDEAMEAERVGDSIAQVNVNIVLEDIAKLKSGARVMLFNACYNGSFNKEGNVASYHIFNGGNCIVSQGNTVNVLQDKWEDQLMGIMAQGARIGQWQKEFKYLESHLLGDPTYRFSTKSPFKPIASISEAKQLLSSEVPVSRAYAVKYLADRNAISSAQLRTIFESDEGWTVRLQVLTAIAPMTDANSISVIEQALTDPYENIRRQAATYAGRSGDSRFISILEDILEDADDSQRLQYATLSALALLNSEHNAAKRSRAMVDRSIDCGLDKEADFDDRESGFRYMRNYPATDRIEDLIRFVTDDSENDDLRVVATEALGWYCHSMEKGTAVNALNNYLKTKKCSPRLREEMVKTVKRLK
ncbi:MAG: HEAT repeat domain-containing protein [Bacteroidales bacterium]|nr:HEAT repeat domain-containing protein [Bacteroidales bacterium]